MQERRHGFVSLATALWPDVEEMAETSDLVLELEGADPRCSPVRSPVTTKAVLSFSTSTVGDSSSGISKVTTVSFVRLANDTKMTFLAVDYRLAPEHPFPAAINDACDVARLVASAAGPLSLGGRRLIVAGDSAGATLAAVVASSTRADSLPIAAQALFYPPIGPRTRHRGPCTRLATVSCSIPNG
jgi:hypothetical protein